MLKAQVIETIDYSRNGVLQVYCPEVSEELFHVRYVSPYMANGQGGMIAIPEAGSHILIDKAKNDDEWYYLGTIASVEPVGVPIDDEQREASDARPPDIYSEERIYEARDLPQRLVFKSPAGNKLVLSDEYGPDHNTIKAELKSMTGKKVSLVDSPQINCVILKNEHGDGLLITGEEHPHFPSRSFISHSRGAHMLTSSEGAMYLRVIDGRDLHIENNSTGMNAPTEKTEQSGNVNISSKYRDVNIFTDVEDGRIFIDAGSHLQLECNEGGITIYSKGKLSIVSEDDIHMKADKSVFIEGGESVDIKSGEGAAIESGEVLSLKASQDVALEGATIQLQDGPSRDANEADPDSRQTNHYGR